MLPTTPGVFGGGAIKMPIRAANGAVTAPSFSFSNFPTTGFYVASGPELYADVGGTAIARFTSAGFILLTGSVFADTIQATSGSSTPVGITGGVRLTERTAPSAPAANNCILYAVDNGGKTELLVLFPSGAAQQIKIEA